MRMEGYEAVTKALLVLNHIPQAVLEFIPGCCRAVSERPFRLLEATPGQMELASDSRAGGPQ